MSIRFQFQLELPRRNFLKDQVLPCNNIKTLDYLFG
jgi:hypothetical protein